jgi:hypothetical protein
MTVHTLLSVDPGKQTGYGWAMIRDGQLLWARFGELPFQRFHEEIDRVLRSTDPAHERIDVYCERFVIGSNTHTKLRGPDPYWSIETTGFLRAVCGITGHHFETQATADAKGDWSDQKLKNVGWWVEGDKAAGVKGTHARDAAKHMLLALQRHHVGIYFDLVK